MVRKSEEWQVKTNKSFLYALKYIKCRRTKMKKIGKENKKRGISQV